MRPTLLASLFVVALAGGAGACAGPVQAVRAEPRVARSQATLTITPLAAAAPPARMPEPTRLLVVEPLAAKAEEPALPGADPRCPIEMAMVGGRVCVDRWEGSLVTHGEGGLEVAFSPFSVVAGSESRVRAVSKAGVVPQGYISGKQARAACAAAGKRLCGPSEWEAACRGPAKTQFPYGNDRKSGVCNDDIRAIHPVAEGGMKAGLPRSKWWHSGMNNPAINQLPNSLRKTGERSGCTNGYGVFDMVGNLHEWVDDPEGTFRGGYYMDTSHNGDGCSYQTKAHDTRYHDYSTGFRCCKDPAPASDRALRAER